ncbi:MAG: OmpA family protein [Kiritimatiellaeota bacterium]|nr:OmpA family protein [Kiritimatiellota bacterium]
MKKLLFTACAAGFAGMLFGQSSFRMTESDRMNREESDLGRWYVSPAGGFMWWQGDLNVKRTGYAALRVGYDVNDTVSFELGGMLAPFIVSDPDKARHGKHKFTNWGHTRNWRGVGQIYGLTTDFVFHMDRDNRWFDPYVRLGMGMYGASEHIFGDNFMAFAPRAGLGFMSHLTDNLAFRAEGITHALVTDDLNWAGSVELGLVYRFGGCGDASSGRDPAPARPATKVVSGAAKAGLIEKIVDGDTVRFVYDLNFANDSAVINPAFFADLDQAIDTLQQFPNATAAIEGHTNQTGTSEYNQKLSQLRADNVRDYLTGKGVDAGRLQARGYGFDMPKVKPASLPENRRVEIIIRGAK